MAQAFLTIHCRIMSEPVSQNAATIRIYGWWERPFGQASAFCTRLQAQVMVQRRRARWRMSGFAVQLREPVTRQQKKLLLLIIRGISCKMGPRIIEAIAMGFYAGILEDYPTIHQGSYCPLVLREGFAVDAPATVTT
jgi:hypothetical protein